MTECDFCGEEFDSDRELHLHWGEEHRDELNSHQEEKVKKAERKEEEEQDVKRSKRRNLLLKGLTGVTLIIFVALVLPQIMAMFQSSPFQLDRQPVMGNESAPVTVVKFGDYQCGHCKTWDAEVKPQLKEDYIDSGDVRLYYINFPVIGQNSEVAARAGEYVLENDAKNFWTFHDEMYSVPTRLTQKTIVSVVTETTNITESEIEEGLDSQNARNELEVDKGIANGNGVSATPTVFVNGERVGNNYQSLKNAIEKQLPDEQ